MQCTYGESLLQLSISLFVIGLKEVKIGLIGKVVQLFFSSCLSANSKMASWLHRAMAGGKKLNLKVFTFGPNAMNGQCKEVVQKKKTN